MDPGKVDRQREMKDNEKFKDKDTFRPASLNKTLYIFLLKSDHTHLINTCLKRRPRKIQKVTEKKMGEFVYRIQTS